MSLNIILITLGSFGDVQPFIGLGMRLKARGHQVLLVTSSYFKPMADQAALDFVPLGDPELYRRLLDNPDMWHPIRGFKTVFGQGVNPTIRPMYELIMQRHVPGKTLVIGSSLAFGARIAQDRHSVPTVTIHLSPSIFRSLVAPARMPGFSLPRWAPTFVRRTAWAVADRWLIDPVVTPEVNALRNALGMNPTRKLLNQWWHSPQLTIGMFPDWFAPPASDWPQQVRLAGFPLHDQIGLEPPPPDLTAFLAEGEPPIVFTAGSAMAHGHRFFRSAVEACVRLGRRGLLLARHGEQIPAHLPPIVRHIPYAPFSQLLPRCAAIVHHGGIGTTAQALRAGIPQLITPMSHDQPDNAMRIRRLGVGDFVAPHRFTPRRAARILDSLIRSKPVAANCRAIARRFEGVDGLARACDLIEEHMPRLLNIPSA